MSTRQTDYPLPYPLAQEAEDLLADVPDRGTTVYRLRRFLGRVYAEGYQDGRLTGRAETQRDQEFQAAHRHATDGADS